MYRCIIGSRNTPPHRQKEKAMFELTVVSIGATIGTIAAYAVKWLS